MKDYLVCAPAYALKTRFIPAHLIYRIKNGHLLREQIPMTLRGGLMVIGRVSEGFGNISELVTQMVRECLRFDFAGVFLALSPVPTAETTEFAQAVIQTFHAKNLVVYLPLTYASLCDDARFLVPGMISSGSFSGYLHDLSEKHTKTRLAIELSCEALDFPMPPDGNMPGKHLTPKILRETLESTCAMTFYSTDLCCNYFTYVDSQNQAHFVIFDTAESILAKKALADEAGFDAAFYLIPPKNDTVLKKLEAQK